MIAFLRCIVALSVASASAAYQLGAGIYDMTGPSVEINFMGYAVPGQRGTGIHQRLRARAFVIGDDSSRFAYVSVDGGMGSDLVKMRVVDELNARFPGAYSTDNVCISGTHTHSGPAGFLQYTLFQITSWGFVEETFDAWVNGIVNAVAMAHENQRSGKILIANGHLEGANINRSPTSYLLNPQEERDQYPEGDTDKNMLLLKLVSDDGDLIGVINWFAVHGTSMNNTNTLVSGDNKGYASYLLEKEVNGANSEPGMGPFVAAFASTNLGDVSPNTAGPICIDTGLPCDGETSSCNGKCENCIASGPGKDMFESTQIIGQKQFDHAVNLMAETAEEVSGPVSFRHSFVDMPNLNVSLSDGSATTLCRPSMGYSFAAGTTDGPGMLKFTQGTTSGNPFWDKVRDFLSTPTEEEIACQAPKPILFNTGDMYTPYQWDPDHLPLQVLRVGNVFIVAPPSEFTTMSGRRLRSALSKVIKDSGALEEGQEPYIAIAGLSNSYSSYVTTYEEFQAQRYEAASTLFGPHTLEGYIQEFSRITTDLVNGQETSSGPSPPDLTDVQISLSVRKFPFDRTPHGTSFGEVVEGKDALASYHLGESVVVTFHSANPRNDKRVQGTYLTVEKEGKLGVFHTVAVDGDWETKFHWTAGKEDPENIGLSGVSRAQITWDIPSTASPGNYRICHHGNRRMPIDNEKIVPFSGCSSTFEVEA